MKDSKLVIENLQQKNSLLEKQNSQKDVEILNLQKEIILFRNRQEQYLTLVNSKDKYIIALEGEIEKLKAELNIPITKKALRYICKKFKKQ